MIKTIIAFIFGIIIIAGILFVFCALKVNDKIEDEIEWDYKAEYEEDEDGTIIAGGKRYKRK